MNLIPEDGSGVENADTFASLVEFRAYATNFNYPIPEEDDDCESLLRRAAVQMGMLRWRGCEVDSLQNLSWPRTGVQVRGAAIASTAIPPRVKQGQMALASELYTSDEEPPRGDILEERVEGVVTMTYAAGSTPKTYAPDSETLFADYICPRRVFGIRA